MSQPLTNEKNVQIFSLAAAAAVHILALSIFTFRMPALNEPLKPNFIFLGSILGWNETKGLLSTEPLTEDKTVLMNLINTPDRKSLSAADIINLDKPRQRTSLTIKDKRQIKDNFIKADQPPQNSSKPETPDNLLFPSPIGPYQSIKIYEE